MKLSWITLLGFLLPACNATEDANIVNTQAAPSTPIPVFGGELPDYWYRGTAEISTYDLTQARYGELRMGEAVLIQVTEPFLAGSQVKDEGYGGTGGPSVPVLKTNLLRRFVTGIYDYSLMTSVFTPTDGSTQPHTLKVTTSSQDWCGQSYTQLNRRGGGWTAELRSYFEREGDQDLDLDADFLEDELFNRIRIGGAPPDGSYRVLPATSFLLLTHPAYRAAAANLATRTVGDSLLRTELHYPELGRELVVTYTANSPYTITGWTETYPGRDSSLLTTATLRERKQTAYWAQNGTADRPLRAELGLK